MSTSEKWLTPVLEGMSEDDWKLRGDPLIAYVRQAIAVPVTLTEWYLDGLPGDGGAKAPQGYCLRSDSLSGKLVMVSFAGEVCILVETDLRPHLQTDLDPWYSAFRVAYSRLSESEPLHAWRAVIGTYYGHLSEVPRLVEGGTIGDVSINASKGSYTEGINRRSNPSLGGATIYSSFPVIVQGGTAGYDWDAAMGRAAVEINTICALLSLAFDSFWAIRIPPSQFVGDSFELPARGFGMTESDREVLGAARDVTLPPWIDRAKEIVDNNQVLYGAVHAYREGLALMDEHPSQSLICFVGAIEAIGSTLEDLTTCTQCGSHSGAGRRFRKALRTVYTNREMRPLVDVYNLRSVTAHAGTLHGHEISMGDTSITHAFFAGFSAQQSFRYQTVYSIREACSRVLLAQFDD